MPRYASAPLRRIDLGPVHLAMRHREGKGVPTLFIHGSFEDHCGWANVDAALSRNSDMPTLTYDRRGHGASSDVAGQGLLEHDVDDAAAIIEHVLQRPTHVVGHSYGAAVALSLAQRVPASVASVLLYEPPLFGLLAEGPEHASKLARAKASMREAAALIEAGDLETGTAMFIDDVAFGPGSWGLVLDDCTRARMLTHALSWLDQSRDPQRLGVRIDGLHAYGSRVTLAGGSDSLPTFRAVNKAVRARLADVVSVQLHGANHAAPLSHPTALAAQIGRHVERCSLP